MDRELIEYFDRRFDQVNRRFDEANEETNRRFDESDRRNEERFAELGGRIDETNSRLDETNSRLDETNSRLSETNSRLDKTSRRLGDGIASLRRDMNDGLRHNRILLEELKGKVDLVIEGVSEELKQDVADVRGEVREVQTRLEVSHVLLDRQLKASAPTDI